MGDGYYRCIRSKWAGYPSEEVAKPGLQVYICEGDEVTLSAMDRSTVWQQSC